MAYVNTTFLPKTNGEVFAERLHHRSDKGRVFGFGEDLVLNFGVTWVTPEPFLVSEDVQAETATFNHAEAGDIFRYRIQTRQLANKAAVINGPWTNTTNTRSTVTVTLPSDDTLEVRFQSQGKDAGTGGQINSFTAWRGLSTPTVP